MGNRVGNRVGSGFGCLQHKKTREPMDPYHDDDETAEKNRYRVRQVDPGLAAWQRGSVGKCEVGWRRGGGAER